MPNSQISSLRWYFQTEKILSEPVHSQNDLWSLIRACEMKPSKLKSMHQRAGLTYYKSTSHKLRILYLKSFLILNKFLLLRELLKGFRFLREQMSWRQSKNWRYTLDKSACGVLFFKNIDFDSDMARAKYLLILSGTCVARKNRLDQSISQKYLMCDGKHTENKEIYPSFKKRGDSFGFMKRQRNL